MVDAPKGWDAMIRENYDGCCSQLVSIDAPTWAIFQPDMYYKLYLATDAQLAQVLNIATDEEPRFLAWLRDFRPPPGSWIPTREGIALRLGPFIKLP